MFRVITNMSRGMRIYTKTGDSGTSSLFSGERRNKTDPIFSSLGDTDELNAHLGLVHALSHRYEDLQEILEFTQRRLIDLGSVIATPATTSSENKLERVAFSPEFTTQLEQYIDRLDSQLPPLRNFILPSGGELSANIHIARAICRRAERSLAEILEQNNIDPVAYTFVNRLSDLLFVMARTASMRDRIQEIPYQKERPAIGGGKK